MSGSSTPFLCLRSICICVVYLHFSVAVTHNISVNIGTLGRIFSPGSTETGQYNNYENVIWNLYVTDPANLELYVYPKHVDIESCCDRVTVTNINSQREIITDANDYTYQALGIDVSGQTSLSFEVQACNDAHVLLMSTPGNEDNDVMEIVFGGGTNSRTFFRTVKSGWPPDANIFHTPLNCNEFRSFWISWTGGVYEVGSGQTVGTGSFLSYTRYPMPTVNAVAISTGWGATGTWRFDWSPREREQCNNGDQPYPTFFSAYPEIVTYTGPNQTPYDADRLADLMRLPTVLCASGMARIEFTTDQSVTYSGFALRFFAIHRFRVIPAPFSTHEAYSSIGQLAIQPLANTDFLIRTSHQKIWLQVVHMNMSVTSIDDMRNPPECCHQGSRLEFHDTFCLMTDCNMAYLCRNPYSITPITLVSHGNEVIITSVCTQASNTDCAIINYKLYDPVTDMGSQREIITDANDYTYQALGIDVSGQTSLSFEVQACNDAHVLLMSTPGNEDNDVMEIVFGGGTNTRTFFRSVKSGWPPDANVFHTPLNCNEFRSFWVSWTSGVYEVGSGQTVGTGSFLSYTRYPMPVVNAVAISTGWGATGTWRFGCTHGTHHDYWQVHSFWALEHTWNVNSGDSALDMTWWIENTSPVEEMLIQVMENQLSRSPDCSSERIEIYRGQCMDITNLVTYFCGGVRDAYKLATSRYAAIRFVGNSRSNYFEDRRFSLWIHGSVDHTNTYTTAYPAYPQPDGGYDGSYFGPHPVPEPYQPYNYSPPNVWDQYVGIWITLILIALLVSLVVVAIQYSKKKTRSRTTVRHQFQSYRHSIAHVAPQTHPPPQTHPIPPTQLVDHKGSTQPQMPPAGSQLYSQSSSPGIPPPSTYDLPPAYQPYPGASAVQITVAASPQHSPHFPAPSYRS